MKKTMLAVAIAISLFSCKKDTKEPTTNDGKFKVGTKWVYKYTDYDESGAIVRTANITASITGQQKLGGVDFWVLTSASGVSYIRKAADGFYNFENNAVQLHYKTPAAVNDTWHFSYSNDAGDYGNYKVLAVNENVTVPMGTIACYYAEAHDSNSLEDKVWYNDDYSMVKQLEYDQNGATLYVNFMVELVSFTP